MMKGNICLEEKEIKGLGGLQSGLWRNVGPVLKQT